MEQVIQAIIQGILLGSLYALYGAGLAIIFGVMKLVNLAHGDLIVAASYMALVLAQGIGLSPFVGLLVVVPIFFGLGWLLQRGLLNFTLGKGELPPLLTTFGLSIILQNALQLGFTPDDRKLEVGSIATASLTITNTISVGLLPLITLVLSITILVGLQLLLQQTNIGRALRATSDDAITAENMGIDSKTMFGVAMGISLALVAIAGIMLGMRTTFTPTDGPLRLIYAFEAVIIGGLGSLWGSFVGGLLLGIAQNLGATLIGPGWFQLAGHLLTLAVLAIRPTGLFTNARLAR